MRCGLPLAHAGIALVLARPSAPRPAAIARAAWRRRRARTHQLDPAFLDRRDGRAGADRARSRTPSRRRTPGCSSSIRRCTTSSACRRQLTREQVARLDRRTFRRGRANAAPRRARPGVRAVRRSMTPSPTPPSTRSRRNSRPATAWWSHRADLRAFPTRTARVHLQRRPRHRPLPGKRALPGRPGRDRAREPRRPLVVRRQPQVRRLDRKAPRRARARPTRLRLRRKAPYLIVTGATASTRVHAGANRGLRAAARHGRARAGDRGLAGGPPVNGQHPYAAHVIELPVRDGRWQRCAFAPGAAAADAPTSDQYLPLSTRTSVEPGLQVPRRALRLGPRLQRARLQRFRFRGLPQHRRAAAAQHQRPGREPGAEPARVQRKGRPRAAPGHRSRAAGRRPGLHSRAT